MPCVTDQHKIFSPRGFYSLESEIASIQKDWTESSRWKDIVRPYSPSDVVRLRGSIIEANTLAFGAAERFWYLVTGGAKKGYVNALGALSGGQAVQMVKGGLEAIYISGWQVAADNNSSLSTYPDQSLYGVDSVPRLVKSVNNALRRADQIQWSKGITHDDPRFIDYFVPILADAEAGFGGVLNAYELCKFLIEAGAGAIHLEDQLSSAKKCGHLGGKVLVPTTEAIRKLVAARLAADVAGVPTVIVARTDADAASLLTSDWDENDKEFLTGERTVDGFYVVRCGIDQAIARGISYAPYSDVVWCETSRPDMDDAQKFANAIHAKFPGKPLAYNCSPSFNWEKNLSEEKISAFQATLASMGYSFQFITLAGIHSMWFNMFDLAYQYSRGEGMKHYVEKVQVPEFEALRRGYTFVAHQQEVGVGYFDDVVNVIQGGVSCINSMKGSTEEDQF